MTSLFLIVLSLGLGAVAYLADFGSDKPQTIFYNSQSHPAFLMRDGDSCPPDRHVFAARFDREQPRMDDCRPSLCLW